MPWAGSASKTKQSTTPTPIRRGIRRSRRRISPCSQRSRSCLLQTGERRVARGKLNRLCFETPSAGFDRRLFQIATIHDWASQFVDIAVARLRHFVQDSRMKPVLLVAVALGITITGYLLAAEDGQINALTAAERAAGWK